MSNSYKKVRDAHSRAGTINNSSSNVSVVDKTRIIFTDDLSDYPHCALPRHYFDRYRGNVTASMKKSILSVVDNRGETVWSAEG